MTSIRTDYIKATAQEVEQFIREYFSDSWATTTVSAIEQQLEGGTRIDIHLRDRREKFAVWWADIIVVQERDKTWITKSLDIESIQFSYKDDQSERERSIHGYGENLNQLYRKCLERFREVGSMELDIKVLPRVPKRRKDLSNWKRIWRKIRGPLRSGEKIRTLAQIGGVSEKTISDVVDAGEEHLLD